MLSREEGQELLREAPFPFLEELVGDTSRWPDYGLRCVHGDHAPAEYNYSKSDYMLMVGHQWLNEYLAQSEKWGYLLKWTVIRRLDPPGNRCSCVTCYLRWKADNE